MGVGSITFCVQGIEANAPDPAGQAPWSSVHFRVCCTCWGPVYGVWLEDVIYNPAFEDRIILMVSGMGIVTMVNKGLKKSYVRGLIA